MEKKNKIKELAKQRFNLMQTPTQEPSQGPQESFANMSSQLTPE